jgi:Txe/YoeB family toxin of Txe-Axe toxin-antitoxin module
LIIKRFDLDNYSYKEKESFLNIYKSFKIEIDDKFLDEIIKIRNDLEKSHNKNEDLNNKIQELINTVRPRFWQLVGATEKCYQNQVLPKPNYERKIAKNLGPYAQRF